MVSGHVYHTLYHAIRRRKEPFYPVFFRRSQAARATHTTVVGSCVALQRRGYHGAFPELRAVLRQAGPLLLQLFVGNKDAKARLGNLVYAFDGCRRSEARVEKCLSRSRGSSSATRTSQMPAGVVRDGARSKSPGSSIRCAVSTQCSAAGTQGSKHSRVLQCVSQVPVISVR